MTADLETSNFELEERRRYMETILAELTAGVVSLDPDGRVDHRQSGGGEHARRDRPQRRARRDYSRSSPLRSAPAARCSIERHARASAAAASSAR